MNLLSAVSLSDYLEQQVRKATGKDFRIGLKWPNDLLVKGRKLSGILLRSNISAQEVNFLVLGIGLNVNQVDADFPNEIREKATSLQMASGHIWIREHLLSGFIQLFHERYHHFLPWNKEKIVELYMNKLLNMEEDISLRINGEKIMGVLKGLTPQGYLILQTQEGRKIVTTGEVLSNG